MYVFYSDIWTLFGYLPSVSTESDIDDLLACQAAVIAGRYELIPYSSYVEYLDALKTARTNLRFLCLVSTRAAIQYKNVIQVIRKIELTQFAGSIRKQPFGVLIVGPPGCGKSKATFEIAAACMSALGQPLNAEEMVVLNESDKYQSEYRSSHKVVVFDDVGSTRLTLVQEDPYRKVIDFINNIPRSALNPHLELKGNVQIRPEIVMMTANKLDQVPQTQVEPGAFWRRFPVKICMLDRDRAVLFENTSVKESKTSYNPIKGLSEYVCSSSYTASKVQTISEIIDSYIIPAYLEHERCQAEYMSSVVLPTAVGESKSPIEKFSSLFRRKSNEPEIVAQGEEGGNGMLLLKRKGKKKPVKWPEFSPIPKSVTTIVEPEGLDLELIRQRNHKLSSVKWAKRKERKEKREAFNKYVETVYSESPDVVESTDHSIIPEVEYPELTGNIWIEPLNFLPMLESNKYAMSAKFIWEFGWRRNTLYGPTQVGIFTEDKVVEATDVATKFAYRLTPNYSVEQFCFWADRQLYAWKPSFKCSEDARNHQVISLYDDCPFLTLMLRQNAAFEFCRKFDIVNYLPDENRFLELLNNLPMETLLIAKDFRIGNTPQCDLLLLHSQTNSLVLVHGKEKFDEVINDVRFKLMTKLRNTNFPHGKYTLYTASYMDNALCDLVKTNGTGKYEAVLRQLLQPSAAGSDFCSESG